MLKNSVYTIAMLFTALAGKAQTLPLSATLDSIAAANPSQRMYEADIRSMDAAAAGARSWMPPEFGAGFFMTPYNPRMTRKMEGENGMGSFMISGQQMIPNRRKLDADEAYMRAMSGAERQRKEATLNDLYATAKTIYYEWMVIKKKMTILDENAKVLDFMVKDAEVRYRNGMDKISAYYKAKAALANVQNMRLMQENEIRMRRYRLNSLMNRNSNLVFDIDTTFLIKDYSTLLIDSAVLVEQRSDLKAIDQQIRINELRQVSEQQSLRPQFGIRYDHMFGFGGQPMQYTLMGMLRIPFARWSSRMTKANIQSITYRNEALESQKQMMVNEMTGMAYGLRTELETRKRQLQLYEQQIIPALRNNYRTMLLGYQQNTEELFMLFDAWESLNMTQVEYLDQLQQLLRTQTELERILQIK